VIVQVCSQILALTHPRQAVVRLHHIVRRQSGVAGEAARDALLDLTDGHRRLYSFLLHRLTERSRAGGNETADLALFLDLADPARLVDTRRWELPLIAHETVRDQLVTGWNAVLRGPPTLRDRHYVRTWLVACENPRYRELLLDVLVRAGDGRDDVLSRLYVLARDWSHVPDEHRAERLRIAARLNSKIDAAQGFDLTDLDLGHRTEETSP
jgi:hypothetical protein